MPGYKGPRCEYKAPRPERPTGHVDTEDVNNTVVSVISILTAILVVVGISGGLFVLYRKRRLGSAFKHRRMAENLIGNGTEFPNQMFSLTEDDGEAVGLHSMSMSGSTNFENPVYDTIYGDPDRPILRPGASAGLATTPAESEVLLADADRIDDVQSLSNEAMSSEAVDLLTEKHRGNIEL